MTEAITNDGTLTGRDNTAGHARVNLFERARQRIAASLVGLAGFGRMRDLMRGVAP